MNIDNVNTKKDLINYVKFIRTNYPELKKQNVDSFLEAIEAWLIDSNESNCHNVSDSHVRAIAQILLLGCIYE